jgi:hypothetical protein
MMVELVADGRDFPVVHVESVFARNGITFEPRDVSQGRESAVKYHVSLDRRLSLDDLSAQLTGGAAALRSVVWRNLKNGAGSRPRNRAPITLMRTRRRICVGACA